MLKKKIVAGILAATLFATATICSAVTGNYDDPWLSKASHSVETAQVVENLLFAPGNSTNGPGDYDDPWT